MAGMIASDLKGLLKIPKKSRLDTITDQYHRIFMVRIIMVCVIVMGVSWYTDSVNCIVPSKKEICPLLLSSK